MVDIAQFTDPEDRVDRPQIIATDLAQCRWEDGLFTATDMLAGTVVGRITASGKYALYDDGNADGTEDAVGIITEDVLAAAADVLGRFLVKGAVYDAKLIAEDAAAFVDMHARSVINADGETIVYF